MLKVTVYLTLFHLMYLFNLQSYPHTAKSVLQPEPSHTAHVWRGVLGNLRVILIKLFGYEFILLNQCLYVN
jgi:hypothetical protein